MAAHVVRRAGVRARPAAWSPTRDVGRLALLTHDLDQAREFAHAHAAAPGRRRSGPPGGWPRRCSSCWRSRAARAAPAGGSGCTRTPSPSGCGRSRACWDPGRRRARRTCWRRSRSSLGRRPTPRALTLARTALFFMKYVYVLATARLPAPLPARSHVVVRARLRRARRHGPDPVSDRPGDQRGPRPRPPRAGPAGAGDHRRGLGPAGAERVPATRGRTRLAGRRAGPAQPSLRPAAAARAVVLRPPADRPADVPRDRRPAVGSLLPRLRADLHRPVAGHDPARRGGDVRRSSPAWRRSRWRRCRSWS